MPVDYVREGKIAILTINRPQALNSLDVETWTSLHDKMIQFRDDDEAWVGIVTGAGNKAFCAGADIKGTLPYMMDRRQKHWDWPDTPMQGLDIWKPLIAAINGHALGGGLEVALSCDIRIAVNTARLGVPEVTLGLIPAWGGTQRLPRAISSCNAAQLLLTGKPVDAQEAFRMGLINKVVTAEELMPAAREMAEQICQAAPLAVRAAKESMVRGRDMSLDEGLRLENALASYLMGTEDFSEGISAFAEKRKPDYKVK